jgi:tetratricopeptide (TPR) repeat protein
VSVRRSCVVAAVASLLMATAAGAGVPPLRGQAGTRRDFVRARAADIIKWIETWQQQVLAHEPGKLDDAFRLIASWPPAKLANTIGAVVTLRAEMDGLAHTRPNWRQTSEERVWETVHFWSVPFSADDLEGEPALASRDRRRANAFFKRAAVLHSDIALFARDDASRRSGPSTAAYIVDGRVIDYESMSIHWGLARQVINLVSPSPADDGFVQRWYHATLAALLTTGNLAAAKPHAEAVTLLNPKNANVQFETGCIQASVAQLMGQIPIVATGDRRGIRGRQRDAEGRFRQALALDPTFVEARVHLGQVLLDLDHAEDAARELAPAYDAAADPRVAYLVAVFLGRAEERSGQLDSAAARYRRAAELCPTAQSPLLALSRLARQSGNKPAARQYVRDALRRQPENGSADPWWEYFEWQVQNPNQLMQDMWALARMEPQS